MGTPTYVGIANITLTGSASSVTFSSISGLYRDLILVVSGTLGSGGGVYIYFNGDTTNSNYSRVYMFGDGSSTGSGTDSQPKWAELSSSQQSNFVTQIFDYSATDKHKSILNRATVPNVFTIAYAGRWANTSAITSILVDPESTSQFAAGTSLALYGVAA